MDVSESNRARPYRSWGLQPQACPSTHPAEEGGVEPPPVKTSSLSRGGGAHAPHLPEESRGIEPPGCHTRHGFLDRLPTIGRYLPKLLPQDSNPVQVVQSHLCCRLHQRALAKDEGFEPSRYGFGDRSAQPTLSNMAALGFEPRFPSYEHGVEPLHYAAEPCARIELATSVWKTGMLPLHQQGKSRPALCH